MTAKKKKKPEQPEEKKIPDTAVEVFSPRHPGGAPTKYDPLFCEMVIAAGKEGKSRAWIAAHLQVARQTLHNWEKEHPEFLDAMEKAHNLAQAWWEDAGQTGMRQEHFKAAVWSRSMAARFPEDWREEAKTTISVDFTGVPDDQLERYVNAGRGIFGHLTPARQGKT